MNWRGEIITMVALVIAICLVAFFVTHETKEEEHEQEYLEYIHSQKEPGKAKKENVLEKQGAQHLFAPKGYLLSVKFPGQYIMGNYKGTSKTNTFKNNRYKVTYTSKDEQLKLMAQFATFNSDTSFTRDERQKILASMAVALGKKLGHPVWDDHLYSVGKNGSGVSYVISDGPKKTPAYAVEEFIIDKQFYVFSARTNSVKYWPQAKDFLKSGIRHIPKGHEIFYP